MAIHNQRYREYLENYHFFPNSIQFRIVSSKGIEKFKNIQSFQLNQLINGKFFFSQDRREILLLKYDMWSRWLVEIENMFIELHDSHETISSDEIKHVINLAKKTCEVYESIIQKEHSHHFDGDLAEIWLQCHRHAFEFMIEEISKFSGTFEDVFTSLVDLLCETLQYTLYEIHELNEILKNPEAKEIFIIANKLACRYKKVNNESLTVKRLNIYKKYFNFDTIWIKNLTQEALQPSFLADIENAGYKIDYKRCLFN